MKINKSFKQFLEKLFKNIPKEKAKKEMESDNLLSE
jgi:hypothetical protein